MEQLAPLDPNRLREILSVLKDYEVVNFKCPEFSVLLGVGVEEDDEDDEGGVADGIGFTVQTDDDEDVDMDSPASMHSRAFGGSMPNLFPKKKT